MFLFFLFLIGLCVGSFLNVLIDRLSRDESIQGRSYCENCHKTLSWKDLIPLVSFVYLAGKCRYCGSKISVQCPILELLTGLMFALAFLFVSHGFMIYDLRFMIDLAYYLIIISSLIVIFFADLKYGIIPDRIIFPVIIISLIWITTGHQPLAISYLLSALGSFLFFLFIYLITKGRGMGFGDVKFAFLMGLILGFPGTVLALYIAFLTGAGIGIILILWKKKRLNFAVPFGPFLVVGTILSFFFANQIIPKIMQVVALP